jgi:hypothetical protein
MAWVPTAILSRASSLVYGPIPAAPSAFQPAPNVFIERPVWRRDVSCGLRRNKFYGSKKSGRNISHVVSPPKGFGADNEDLHLPFACIRCCRFGGGDLNDVIAVDRAG